MSAIFGIFDLEGRTLDTVWVKSMQDDLVHRGPDGQGLYQEDSLVLGHMLLQVTPESIYDRSPYEEAGFVITANARLDEREALMDRLNIAQEERQTITDPLLLLRSYIKFGDNFVKDIYGDFSFAIWDKEKKELFCARDQMGVKPFLYYLQDNRFIFSTELKSIVKLSCVKTEIDHYLLRDITIGIWEHQQKTIWKNILRLKPAHTLLLKDNKIFINRYWAAKYKRNKQFKTEEDSASRLRILLERVIADHTRVIGGVGVPLSGGLDSSTIACLAARQLNRKGKKLTTVSSVYSPGYSNTDRPDEMEYITEVLQQEKNIEPTYVYNADLSYINGLKEQFNLHYAPVNGFYYVDEALYKQLHGKSVHRVMSGLVGDYTISNNIIKPLPVLLLTGRFSALKKLFPQVRKSTGQSFVAFIKSHFILQLAPNFLLKYLKKYKENIKLGRNIEMLPLVLQQEERLAMQKKILNSLSTLNIRIKNIEENIWPKNTDFLGGDWDCRTAHHQIEMTYPLCDRRIIELLMQIPVEHFYGGGNKRGLVRKAMTGILPDKIRDRKGKGVYSPGYPSLIKNEIFHLNLLIRDDVKNYSVNNIIDIEKLKLDIIDLSKSINNNNFNYQYWTLVSLAMSTYFVQFFINKEQIN